VTEEKKLKALIPNIVPRQFMDTRDNTIVKFTLISVTFTLHCSLVYGGADYSRNKQSMF